MTARIALGKAFARLREQTPKRHLSELFDAAGRETPKSLRDKIDEVGLTTSEVAEYLGIDQSMVTRIERGNRQCSQPHFAKLMDAYDVGPDERDELAELHATSRQRDQVYWGRYRDDISVNYERVLSLEAAASQVREYQLGILPALVQTEGYSRAVTAVGFASLGPDQVDSLVEVKSLRQRHRLLDTKTPMECHYVITQAALEFQVGGRQTQLEQLQHLLEMSDHPSVTIQVIPYEKGEAGAQLAGFNIFSFGKDLPDVAFGESVAGSTMMDDPRDLRRLHRLFKSLVDVALSPSKTSDLIATIQNKEL